MPLSVCPDRTHTGIDMSNGSSEIDLGSLSLADLRALQNRVARAIDNYEAERLRRARAELDMRARELGFTLDEVLGAKGRRPRPDSRARYANPANPRQTWTGRGRQPRWFAEALAAGRTKQSMEV